MHVAKAERFVACRKYALYGIHVHGGRHAGSLARDDGLGEGHACSRHLEPDVWLLQNRGVPKDWRACHDGLYVQGEREPG